MKDDYEAFQALQYIMHGNNWRFTYVLKSPKLKNTIELLEKKLKIECLDAFNELMFCKVRNIHELIKFIGFNTSILFKFHQSVRNASQI